MKRILLALGFIAIIGMEACKTTGYGCNSSFAGKTGHGSAHRHYTAP